MFEAKPDPRALGRASRISVSLAEPLLERLQELAEREGRSLSNLCARLLEHAIEHYESLE